MTAPLAQLVFFFLSLLGAFLLFLLQPMAAKLALPLLGGAPNVWNACMVFFQSALLGGYLYAHLLTRRVRPEWVVPAHILFMLAAVCLYLPLTFPQPEGIDPTAAPLRWLLLWLAGSIGVPFFLLSATAPLVQHMYATRKGDKPYALYAASNAGSFFSLLGYPLLIEPQMTVEQQAGFVSGGFYILLALFAVLAFLARRPVIETAVAEAVPVAVVTNKDRLTWLVLSMVPASLLYGVTSHIVTDVASVPLVWVIPLALYLLTFIIAFTDRAGSLAASNKLQTGALTFLLLVQLLRVVGPWTMVIHLTAFFLIVLICHGRLYNRRPADAHLTQFYLFLSLGGVLGGMFNTLLAPLIFTHVVEYPLVLAVSLLICASRDEWVASRASAAKLAALAAGYIGLLSLLSLRGDALMNALHITSPVLPDITRFTLTTIAVTLLYLGFSRMRPAYGIALLVFWFAVPLAVNAGSKNPTLFTERNFFGISEVIQDNEAHAMRFVHGLTVHGVQSLEPSLRMVPLAYHGQPLAEVVKALPDAVQLSDIAVLGMGAGTASCYGSALQHVDAYEIDPSVIRIAQNPDLFTFMRDCPPDKNIIIGDARLQLQKAQEGQYGLMIVDVFTSDAIPVHLATKEAMQLYLHKLAPHGLIAFNISNHFLDLRPVLNTIAQSLDATVRFRQYKPGEHTLGGELQFPSRWAVMARSADDLKTLPEEWKAYDEQAPRFLWTDHFSNILSVMRGPQTR